MIEEIESLLKDYIVWLKDKTILRQIDDWVEITTPYLDRHNDYVQIYAKKMNGGFVLTDDGYTIDDLEQSGCKLESRKRQDLLSMTLNGFGIKLRGKALEVRATPENFALRKHNLVQAVLAVNDMFCLAVPMVASLFYEDVVAWLDLHEIRYTPKVKFTGKSATIIFSTSSSPNRDGSQRELSRPSIVRTARPRRLSRLHGLIRRRCARRTLAPMR